MGLFDGRMNGVNPCTFLNAAYGLSHDLRQKMWPDRPILHTPEFDYTCHRKGTDGRGSQSFWPRENWYYSFPYDELGWSQLGRPVPEEYWNDLPRWSEIYTYDEQMLIEEEIIPTPYRQGGPSIADPAWPLQRHKVIQHMRYLSVPLDIRTKEYNGQIGVNEWKDYKDEDHYYRDNCIDRDNFYWATTWGCVQVEARISEYWRQGNTVCKIGYEGRWKDDWDQQHHPPAPLNGCAWSNGNYFLSSEFNLPGYNHGRCIVKLYGVVDLATHPDFEQYFDINEEEEQ